MRFHPAQGDQNNLQKIAQIFRTSMERHEVLPVNPWKAKRLERWLARMGARFQPETHNYRSLTRVDTQNYVNFKVPCPLYYKRIKGRREARWVRIEIPWELADKVLALGHLP